MERYPDQARELAKELAAFGTSNPGVILLGVTDDGERVGLENMGSRKNRDLLQTRIEGVSSSGINPSLLVRVRFDGARSNTLAVIEVPKRARACLLHEQWCALHSSREPIASRRHHKRSMNYTGGISSCGPICNSWSATKRPP